MTRIILAGAGGKLGRAVAAAIADRADMRVAAGVDIVPDAHAAFAMAENIDLAPQADCVVSCLPPDAAQTTHAIIDHCVRRRMSLVVCTTALDAAAVDKMHAAAADIAVLHGANMSFGANFLAWVLRLAAKQLFEMGFDAEIIETHHSHKQDAPSGTALGLLEILRGVYTGAAAVYGRSPMSPPRARGDIGLHSIRGGGLIGEHRVLFASPAESVEITHRAQSRDVYALGTLAAVRFVSARECGFFTMADLLDVAASDLYT